jgi:hypothetical protein
MNAVVLADADKPVLRVRDLAPAAIPDMLARFGLRGVRVADGEAIPGSYWGDSEAGLVLDAVYWRADTPIHSVLHEASHAICMDSQRRAGLDRDAGGDFDEENAVCYLQIVLAEELAGVGRQRMCSDMDVWGYTFRLGSASAWFAQDAEDARQWLLSHGLLGAEGRVTWRMRD